MRYQFYLIFAFVGLSTLAHAQWTALNGPSGGYVYDLERDGSGNTYALVNRTTLFKSTDNGATWTKLTTSPASLTLNDVLYANNKFYAIYFSSFYTSTDGLTWTRVTTVPFTGGYRLLKFGPDGYIAVYGTDGMYVTKDDGVNWTKASGDDLYAFGYERAVATANGDLYVISRGDPNVGVNYGFEIKKLSYPGASGTFNPANWQTKYSTIKTGTITTTTSSNVVTGAGTLFTTQLTVGTSLYTTTGQYIGGVSSITNNTSLVLYSNASTAVTGSAFTEYLSSAQLLTNGSKVYLFYDRDILVTEDGGSTWPSIKGNITDGCFWGYGDVSSSGTLYYYNGCYNKIYSLTNPGTTNSTWSITDVNSSIGSFSTNIVCWTFVNSTTALAGSNLVGIFKTTNSGSTYSLSSNGLTGATGRSIAMTNSGNKIINTFSNTRGYWLSNDLGVTWSFVSTTNTYSKALKLSDGTLILYGNNYIARSTDNLATPFVEASQVNADLVEASDGTLFVTYSNTVFTSIDKGATWTALSTPLSGWPAGYSARFITVDNTNLYINASSSSYKMLKVARAGGAVTDLTSYPVTTGSLANLFTVGSDIYAATTSIIYKSSDQGTSWTSIGFSGSAVFPLSDGVTTALCVSRPGGFYLTQDGGNSWNSFSLPTSTAYITGLTKDPASSAASPIYYSSAAISPALKFTGKLIVDPTTLPQYINFNWQPLGGPYGGSQTDVEIAPDGSLYSLMSGVMFKYSNNSWARLNPLSPSLTSVVDLEIDASGKIYALLSSGSVTTPRIYVSVDGGSTWSSKAGLFKVGSSYYNGARMEKMPDNSIIVVTSSGVIFRSTDDAVTFASVADYSSSGGFFSSSFPIIRTANLVAAFEVNTLGVVYSTNNGATWTANGTNGTPTANSFKVFNNYAIAPNGDFLMTIAEAYDATKSLYYPIEIYRSTDFGLNWSKVTSPSPGVYSKRIMVMPNGDYIMGINNTFSQYKSTDKGVTWTALPNIGETFSYYEQAGSDVYLKGISNGIYKSSDNGTTLTPIINGMPRSSGLEIKLLDNKDLIVASSQPFYSSDFGQSWTKKETQNISRFLVKGDSVIGYGGRLNFLSTDNGKTWTAKGTDRFFSFITTFDGKSYYAVSNTTITGRGLFFSTDLVNWTQINVTGLPSDPLSFTYQSLAIDQNGVIYVVINQSGATSLYQIAFEVATKISGIINPTAPVKAIFYKNKIYVYDNIGAIYETQDGGVSWQTISAPGGTTFTISSDYFFIMGTNTVLWVSRNNGASWQSVGESFIVGSNFQDVIVNEYDGFAYAVQTNNVAKKSQVIVMVDDKTNPLATTLSPVNNATGVSLKPTLSITFNEAVLPVATKKIRLFDPSLGSSIEQIDVMAGVQDGKKFTFTVSSTLAFNKVYYFTVDVGAFKDIFGNNYAGLTSNTAWRFTTKTAPTVNTLSPANAATGVLITSNGVITFSEPVSGVGGKNVVLYAASAPSTPVATLGATTGASSGNTLTYTFAANTLQYNTQYFIKADASAFTTADGGVFSALTLNTDWTFTTIPPPDTQAPVITHAPPTLDKSASSNTFNTTITDNVGVTTPKIFYRSITSSGTFTSADLTAGSNNVFTINLLSSVYSSMPVGIEYYFTASDAAGNTVRSPQGTANYNAYFSLQGTSTIPTMPPGVIGVGGNVGDWKIISIPHKLADPNVATILSVLGTSDFSKWRLVTYKDQTAWDEYPTNFNSFTQGKGYFINVKSLTSSVTIAGANSPSNNKGSEFKLSLYPGWNMIGNPYNFAMGWDEVKTYNASVTGISGISSALKTFSSGSYIDVPNNGKLEVFQGAFVLNSGTSKVDVLIPIVGKYAGARVAAPGPSSEVSHDLASEQWVAPMTLKIGDVENTFGGVGMNPGAVVGVDQFDDFNPPRWLEYAEMSFAHPEHFLKASTRDIVPSKTEYDWTFTVNTNVSEIAELKWDNTRFGFNSKELVLFDVNRETLIDMRELSSYSFDPKKSSTFKIYYGDDLKSKIKPIGISLGDAFPNPSNNNKVTIPFTLPEGQAEYHVTIDVYDIMGQKISTLVNQSLASGFYTTQWEPGQEMNAGLYMYRMTTCNRTSSVLTKKIIVTH